MIPVEFHRLAANELRAASHWYAKRSPETAVRFELAVEAAVMRIRTDPDALPIERRHLRWVRVRRFPYRLIFEHREPQRLVVIAVAHASRRPGYWRRRT